MSIGLAAALCGLTALALAVLLAPLLGRRRSPASREAYNLAVYRDQLTEVERDLARGVLAANEAEAARAEIARRILALRPADAEAGAGPMAHAAAIVAILLLPTAAGMLYWRLGSPALPDRPFAERTAETRLAAEDLAHIDINAAVARLAAHLKEHPDDLTGLLLLARTTMSLGRYQEAAEAYRRAADLSGHRPEIMSDWGETQVLAAGGTVTPAAREALAAGLSDPETAPRSRYYLALAQLQQGDVKGALQGWRDLAAQAPADAAWLPLVQQRISEAESALGIDPAKPNPAAGAAGTSPEARQAMINAMVERLAARLEQQPDDVEGWVRLGHSYMVLHQPDKAREAYARAVRLKPDDAELKQALAEASTAAAGKIPALAPAPSGAK